MRKLYLVEQLCRTRMPAPIVNAIVVARGERIVAWSADGTSFLMDARTGECRWMLRPPDRVFALEDGGALACLRRGSDEAPDVALWDLASGERVASLAGLPRRSFAFAIRPTGVTTSYHDGKGALAQARRIRFDRRGTPLTDQAVSEVRTRALAVWTGVVLGDVVRASPLAEVVLAPDDTTQEIAIGVPLDDRGERYDYRVRGSVGGPGSAFFAVHAVHFARVRVVDVLGRRVVTGRWDAIDVRAAFFVGPHLVTATDHALDASELQGRRLFSRPISALTQVARIDDRLVALGRRDGIAVLDVAGDAVVAHVRADARGALFGGDGVLAVTDADGTITLFAHERAAVRST